MHALPGRRTLRPSGDGTGCRDLAYVVSFSTSGTHTIKVVVVSGRVDVDAFVVLR
jgi:hypothetical protein